MWNTYVIEDATSYMLQLFNHEIFVMRNSDNWNFAIENSTAVNEEIILKKKPSEKELTSWKGYVTNNSDALLINPGFPDRPLVVKSLFPLIVLPNRSIKIFIKIPVWYVFYCGSISPENKLFELPSKLLSSTWFGDPSNGTYSYELEDNFNSDSDEILTEKYGILCPVTIHNKTKEHLNFERLFLTVDSLSIFHSENSLFTNDIEIIYKGTNMDSELKIVDLSISKNSNTKILTEPRNPDSKNLVQRSFYFFKSLTQ